MHFMSLASLRSSPLIYLKNGYYNCPFLRIKCLVMVDVHGFPELPNLFVRSPSSLSHKWEFLVSRPWHRNKSVLILIWEDYEFLEDSGSLRSLNTVFKHFYYMTSSVSGQDEPNRALWLATRAGKVERYCLLRISWCFKAYNKSFNYWPSLFGQDGWILASFFFCVFMDLTIVGEVHKHAKKERGQYPAILTSRLVNNPYIRPFLPYLCSFCLEAHW